MSELAWYYFGCRQGQSGHYLSREGGHSAYGSYGSIERELGKFDGSLTPWPENETTLYKAALSRLGGLGYSALAWWDRSQDARGASNSIVFAPSLTIEPADMLDAAYGKFPWVFARLPKPLHMFHPMTEGTTMTAEREAIVRWLEKRAARNFRRSNSIGNVGHGREWVLAVEATRIAAAIQEGEHLKESTHE